MAQGARKPAKAPLKAKAKGSKAAKAAKNKAGKPKGPPKKGSFQILPKQSKARAAAKQDLKVTKLLNATNEQAAAAKVFQNREKVFLTDLKEKGRELARDIRRSQVKRKKTRVEEKLAKAKEKLERVGSKHDS